MVSTLNIAYGFNKHPDWPLRNQTIGQLYVALGILLAVQSVYVWTSMFLTECLSTQVKQRNLWLVKGPFVILEFSRSGKIYNTVLVLMCMLLNLVNMLVYTPGFHHSNVFFANFMYGVTVLGACFCFPSVNFLQYLRLIRQPTSLLQEDNTVTFKMTCEFCAEQPNSDCGKCQCAICFDTMHNKMVSAQYNCTHLFHLDDCSYKLRQRVVGEDVCPVCRAPETTFSRPKTAVSRPHAYHDHELSDDEDDEEEASEDEVEVLVD